MELSTVNSTFGGWLFGVNALQYLHRESMMQVCCWDVNYVLITVCPLSLWGLLTRVQSAICETMCLKAIDLIVSILRICKLQFKTSGSVCHSTAQILRLFFIHAIEWMIWGAFTKQDNHMCHTQPFVPGVYSFISNLTIIKNIQYQYDL